jgi:uncharacterized pyridoxamine 5'-phosphate oxidase family protein
MPLRILDLGKQFRPATSIIYPPFKNGRYMEEYFYNYILSLKDSLESEYIYIPAFWTNIQNHPNFHLMKENYNVLLKRAYNILPEDTKYFTVVQADLGVELVLPKNTIVFGACHGNIQLPLIYEDTTNKLLNTPRLQTKEDLASFVGTYNTHSLRTKLFSQLSNSPDIKFVTRATWTNNIPENLAEIFINTTLNSKFCLAPRGFGRNSFRFFEAMLLDCIPVYFWDDIEWLPYKDILDYTKFAISIQEKDIPRTVEILKSISNETYLNMIEELKRVRHYFTLDGMAEYIIGIIKS